ncbi:WYL domain-containing protein [Halomonas sp. B23F22_10]|uniref:WYL domain-containing protein n=1 Tax=Halomonas sp. B23F22_10 TaxID=3459515 RepID=UPI00373E75EF
MEGLIFWALAGVVMVFMIRRTKRKAREAEADAKRRRAATQQHIQGDDAGIPVTIASRQSPHLSGTSAPSSDGRLRFVYEDANGNTSTREVTDFSDDGVYIEGFCHSRRAVRTFRRDRVVEYLEGEELLVPMIDASEFVDESFADRPGMEILFTGFSEDERFDLEADAEDAGLVVRKTVTKNLMFVCAGPRAGSSKLAKARGQGCMFLDRSQLNRMLLTGEVPKR